MSSPDSELASLHLAKRAASREDGLQLHRFEFAEKYRFLANIGGKC